MRTPTLARFTESEDKHARLRISSMPPMTPGIEYALGAMLFFGLGDLVYKRGAAAGAQAHHFLMVQSWVFAPSVVLYAILTGSMRFVAGSLWGALAALASLAYG